ncbi:MAG: polysaccharide biosynthesis/export family protein [Bacteroidaceae bacterium]|nr:polysaccharide biosynthesis/export family protein [Bacteroidaceae bacterium]
MKTLQKKSILLVSLLSVLLLASCTSYKKVPYLQNSGELASLEQSAVSFEPTIQPLDLLNIVVVNTENPSASMPYNLTAPSDISRTQSMYSQPTLQNYLVGTNGCVTIPSVGEVNIGGLTIAQAEEVILNKIKGAFSTMPVVTVRFVDFKISVLGEVAAPGTYSVKNGKVNIFQALALARDLTIYGRRDNVKVIREDKDGKKEIVELNLNDAGIINSPYYYLQQNDVVYVTPNKSKAKNSDIGSSTSLWFSGTSILISLTSLLYNILK